MPKLRLYNQYKLSYTAENYLFCDIPRKFRMHLARFRTCTSQLEIELGRQAGRTVENRLCTLCGDENVCIEDEFHVLMKCPSYKDIRQIYLGNVANMYDFIKIMSSQSKEEQIRVAHYTLYV